MQEAYIYFYTPEYLCISKSIFLAISIVLMTTVNLQKQQIICRYNYRNKNYTVVAIQHTCIREIESFNLYALFPRFRCQDWVQRWKQGDRTSISIPHKPCISQPQCYYPGYKTCKTRPLSSCLRCLYSLGFHKLHM